MLPGALHTGSSTIAASDKLSAVAPGAPVRSSRRMGLGPAGMAMSGAGIGLGLGASVGLKPASDVASGALRVDPMGRSAAAVGQMTSPAGSIKSNISYAQDFEAF